MHKLDRLLSACATPPTKYNTIIFYVSFMDQDKNRQACGVDYAHNVTDSSWRLPGFFVHTGTRTGDPISDRHQVQDFSTELRVLEFPLLVHLYKT